MLSLSYSRDGRASESVGGGGAYGLNGGLSEVRMGRAQGMCACAFPRPSPRSHGSPTQRTAAVMHLSVISALLIIFYYIPTFYNPSINILRSYILRALTGSRKREHLSRYYF